MSTTTATEAEGCPSSASTTDLTMAQTAQFARTEQELRAADEGALVQCGRAFESNFDRFLETVLDVWAARFERFVETSPIVQTFQDRPLAEATTIIGVGFIMGTIYVSFVYACMPALGLPLMGTSSVVFHSSFLLAALSYEKGITTDPGRIPDEWRKVDCSESETLFLKRLSTFTRERKKTGKLRFCNKEMKWKPDRAHYCSVLSRNVLRLDHYCPWLANAVGYFNHKYFLLFLFYAVVATTTADVNLLHALSTGTFPAGSTVMMANGAALSSLISFVLTPFFGLHCWLTSINLTTIEYCEKFRNHETTNKGATRSPYDVGWYRNVECVMGKRLYLWPLPIADPAGDGLQWGVAEEKQRLEDDAVDDGSSGEQSTSSASLRDRASTFFTEAFNTDNLHQLLPSEHIKGTKEALREIYCDFSLPMSNIEISQLSISCESSWSWCKEKFSTASSFLTLDGLRPNPPEPQRLRTMVEVNRQP